MRVTDITLVELKTTRRVQARVEWEEADREPITVFAELENDLGDGFWPDPNGFFTACVLPAWHAGERRIYIDGDLCPSLSSGIRAAFATLRTWYPEMGQPPVVEASRSRGRLPAGTQTASFLSCGVDSLALLRQNRLEFPAGHPHLIKAVLLVDFLEADPLRSGENVHQARKRLASARCISRDAAVDPIPLTSNILYLEPDGNFVTFKHHAAAFAFCAHILSGRFHKAILASSYDAAHLEPWGSHPLLDTHYGSSGLQIEHSGVQLTRYEKTALLADWPAALQSLLVCQGKDSGETNCGQCEKCIRTMTTLVALDKLPECAAFPVSDVTPELLQTVIEYGMIYSDSQAAYYREIATPLRRRGRVDLAAVVERILDDYAGRRSLQLLSAAGFASALPNSASFALADNEIYGGAVPDQRRGHFWGQPSDGKTAVRELEALRDTGVTTLIFRRPTFWWLTHYAGFQDYLRNRYRCLLETEELIVFDLQDTLGTGRGQ